MRLLVFFVVAAAALAATPEERAVQYLAREVPRWSQQNHCFSCHNNGDGARALFVARRMHYSIPAGVLADTTEWLMRPWKWDHKQAEFGVSDKKMALVQFSAALVEAGGSPRMLLKAADALLACQDPDGSWQIGGGVELGSPVTWGPVLATRLMRDLLERADPARYHDAIARAAEWLRNVQPKTVPDAAVVLLDSGRPECLALIRGAQSSDGGWGPRPHAPAEPFDTALVLLALAHKGGEPQLVEQGRAFLIRAQLPSGGWTETTRPAGAQSYAQHISTTAWATLALLATHPER